MIHRISSETSFDSRCKHFGLGATAGVTRATTFGMSSVRRLANSKTSLARAVTLALTCRTERKVSANTNARPLSC